MGEKTLYFNGIRAKTGDYALPPASAGRIASLARADGGDPAELKDHALWLRQGKKPLRQGDAWDLSQAGWGILFAAEDPMAQAIKEALDPLLAHRKAEAGRAHAHFYRELMGRKGYRPGDTKLSFLGRLGVGPGAADPEQVPYYLLIVGDPERIPFSFQYQLDVQYAVGRVCFDTPEEYAHYARRVVAAETAASRRRRAAIFAPQHQDDPPTVLSVDLLAAPLAEHLRNKCGDWEVRSYLREEATKKQLRALLAGEKAPEVLFTAGHGVVVAPEDPDQVCLQGGLVCSDWQGRTRPPGPLTRKRYLCGEDLNAAKGPTPLVTFHFACYSAGAPAWNDFARGSEKVAVAPRSFVSDLPRKLLSKGALAVIGHVDLAWECSIEWPDAGQQIQAFEDAMERLLQGHPVGWAMEPFGTRYAELSSDLNVARRDLERGDPVADEFLAALWTGTYDSRNYIVLGDPAVRLALPAPAS
jgi:hypothetical protein